MSWTKAKSTRVLREHGIRPSAQRVAVAQYVLGTTDHPSAEQVLSRVQGAMPVISRATVYNTLNVLVEKGLLRQFVLTEGRTVFDPNTKPHHHLVDERTGEIHDIPWDRLAVSGVPQLEDEFEVDEFQVVVRGRKRS